MSPRAPDPEAHLLRGPADRPAGARKRLRRREKVIVAILEDLAIRCLTVGGRPGNGRSFLRRCPLPSHRVRTPTSNTDAKALALAELGVRPREVVDAPERCEPAGCAVAAEAIVGVDGGG